MLPAGEGRLSLAPTGWLIWESKEIESQGYVGRLAAVVLKDALGRDLVVREP